MITEIIGLSGSGKTYYSTKIIKKQPIDTNSKLERITQLLLFIITKPIISTKLFRLLYKENKQNKQLFYHKIRLLINAVTKEQKSSFLKEGVIDEGILQFIYTFYEREITTNQIEKDLLKIIKKICKNHEIIFLDANKKIRYQRMKKRNRFPRSKFGMEYSKQVLKLVEQNQKSIKKFMKINFKIKYVLNN